LPSLKLAENKSIYFASDFHLGAPNQEQSRLREQKIVQWLEEIKPDCSTLYLMGDVFDFWFDYGSVIPAGYTRLLGKLAAFRDDKIPVYFFTGNHDIWMFNYFEDELNIPILRKPTVIEVENQKLFLAHGDGLGPNDKGFKRLKKIFTNPFCQFLFSWLHPKIGMWVAHKWSNTDISQYNGRKVPFLGEQEWLVQYARKKLTEQAIDYFIFGHRHTPVKYQLNNKSTYINLGDWINHNSYAKFNGQQMELLFYP